VVIKASPRPIESQPGPLPDVVLARALPAATSAPAAAITASVVMKEPVRDEAPPRRLRDEQLDAGEAALRRGDLGAAAQILGPWASAGVPRAQALLGRAQEARSGGQRSDFEAYVWYSMAARGGEPGAQAMKDQVAARLQPAEIRQAEKIIEHWKPRAEPTVAGAP
jgi:TPR repeat protein